jgi:hypothetical protein
MRRASSAKHVDPDAPSAPLYVAVSLTVLCASIAAAADAEFGPNAYVVATLTTATEAGRELGKTPVVRDSVEPVWHEPSSATFKLQVPL